MKNNSLISNLFISALFAFAAYANIYACPIGVSGLAKPNATVCAKDADGKLWCTKANANGNFNITGGQVAPSADTSCLPTIGEFFIFDIDCPENGEKIERPGPQQFGGLWLNVTCGSCSFSAPNPIAWYTFDELTGNKASDLAQRGSNGFTYPPSSPIDGKYFGSPSHLLKWVDGTTSFDGIDDYVEAPNHPSLNFGTGDFSIGAWVKIEHPDDAKGVRVLVEKRAQIDHFPQMDISRIGSFSSYFGYSFYLHNGRLGLQLADGTHFNYGSQLIVPADGKWHFAAVTVDRNHPQGGTFYLSQGPMGNFSIQTATFNPTNKPGSLDNTRPLRIGSLTLNKPESLFKGSLDEVMLFNRMLTSGEIANFVEAGRFGKCRPCFLDCN